MKGESTLTEIFKRFEITVTIRNNVQFKYNVSKHIYENTS